MSPASPAATSSDKMEDASMVTPDGVGSNSVFISEAVKDPSENDVLCGRGGSINSHPGNERFRSLVEKRKRVYLTARFKREKRLIASSIVSEIRGLDPPGRFLLKDSKTGLWQDIGDEKARDKTSQALRENAPSIRAEIETEINEQRAELQREDEASRPPPPPPPPEQSYYSSGWGYQSYYGYSHSAPPPPPPPGHPGYPPPYEGHWGSHPPPPPPPHYYGDQAPYRPPPPPQKSVVERTAEYVASGAESIKSWTRNSFVGSIPSSSSHDSRSASSMNSKPLSYVHEGSSRKRRVVKFQDESTGRRRSTRPCYSPINGGATVSSNSLIDGTGEELQVIEPQHLDAAPDAQSSSLMTQFANQVLGSIGSWDAGTICGYADGDEKVPFPESNPSSAAAAAPVADDEHMEVEWEGQEVQLVPDRAEQDSVASDERMPPPVVRPKRNHDHDSSVAFSSLGSCHSWIPEQFGSAASFFSGSRNAAPPGVASVPSMDMEYSATGGTENYSAAGSINFSAAGSVSGNSLSRVFEHEAHDYSMASPTHMNHRELSQMPSWERSLRSRSPLSIGSEDDDASLVSKSSSKVSEGQLSSSRTTTPQHANGMAWE